MVPRLNNSQTVGPSALQASVALHAIEDLANRLALVSVAQQHVDVARVNRQVYLAPPAVLIALMFWPDMDLQQKATCRPGGCGLPSKYHTRAFRMHSAMDFAMLKP